MKAGVMPGGDAVCHGHHVWDEDECLRCGLIDRDGRGGIDPGSRNTLTKHDTPSPALAEADWSFEVLQ